MHAQTLGFYNSVNHQETSRETVEAQRRITLHRSTRTEGWSKTLQTVPWFMLLQHVLQSIYSSRPARYFTANVAAHIKLVSVRRVFMRVWNLHIINEMKMKAFTLG